jgi:hypothetical protein
MITIDEDLDGFSPCECALCEGNFPSQIIKRGNDEYIIMNGRILTLFGAPASGSEDAFYYLHENLVRPLEEGRLSLISGHDTLDSHLAGHLWPEKAGVFKPDDLVDLYRMLHGHKEN